MVLSILIPVYNRNIRSLVHKLYDQAELLSIDFEIICIDDCSTITFPENDSLKELKKLKFITLKENIGRARIRNLLANTAIYPNLLFVDNDMQVLHDDYLKKYIDEVENADCIYGGLCYEKPLLNEDYILRWKYGLEREEVPVSARLRFPYISLKPCNLFIKKEVFKILKFDERFLYYGHEDTFFSIQLSELRVKVMHINNPLLHDGLENAEVFLKKVESSSVNLKKLSRSIHSNSLNHIKLIRTANLLNKLYLTNLFIIFYKISRNGFENNLKSNKPSLTILDLYKLYNYLV